MKIIPVRARRMDGQTDRQESRQADRQVNLTVLFHRYSNAPTNTFLRERKFSLQRQEKIIARRSKLVVINSVKATVV